MFVQHLFNIDKCQIMQFVVYFFLCKSQRGRNKKMHKFTFDSRCVCLCLFVTGMCKRHSWEIKHRFSIRFNYKYHNCKIKTVPDAVIVCIKTWTRIKTPNKPFWKFDFVIETNIFLFSFTVDRVECALSLHFCLCVANQKKKMLWSLNWNQIGNFPLVSSFSVDLCCKLFYICTFERMIYNESS